MHLVDCGTNAQVAANQKRKCSQYILVSNELQNNIDTIVTKFEQNNKDLFVGSMSVKDILSIAMIPDLDFSLGLKEFAQYTHDQIALPVPERWQRPLDLKREKDIRGYYYNQQANNPSAIIPGAIIIGERDDDDDFPRSTNLELAGGIGVRPILRISTNFTLRQNCCANWNPPDLASPFFDRCGHHNIPQQGQPQICDNHKKSVLPFQIIDGQHRVLGIYRHDPEAQVPVVFMLQQKGANDEHGYLAVRGVDSSIQAEVFEKVNNAAKGLEQEHQLWVTRFLTDDLTDEEKSAFDQLANLGKTTGNQGNPWKDRVAMGPTSRQPNIKATRGAWTKKSGGSGALARIWKTLKGYSGQPVDVNRQGENNPLGQLTIWPIAAQINSPPERSQLINFLKGAMSEWQANAGDPTVNGYFGVGGGARPFRSGRIFEKLLWKYDLIARWAIQCQNDLSHRAFYEAWELHATSFAAQYANNWKIFSSDTGEPPWQRFVNIWELMWPDPATIPAPQQGQKEPPQGPDWETLGGAALAINWGEYCNLGPDPITLNQPGTPRIAGVTSLNWADNGGVRNNIALANNNLDIEWIGPRNTLPDSNSISFDVYRGGDWLGETELITHPKRVREIHDNDFCTNYQIADYVHTLTLDMAHSGCHVGDRIKFVLVDENHQVSRVEFEYDIA